MNASGTIPELSPADETELHRWSVPTRRGRISPRAYLADQPPDADVMPRLIRLLDRPGRGGALGRLFASYLHTDVDTVLAGHHPRRAAKLAAECRARGEHPHADKLQAELVRLMHCANCGHPLTDPLSVDRGIGSDCWETIAPHWRAAIAERLAAQERQAAEPVAETLF